MKPLQRSPIWPIVFFICALSTVIRVPSLLGYDDVNSFLVIAWVFISAAFLFLGISYFTPLFSTGWPRLLLGLAGFVMLLTVVIEVIGR